MTSIPKKTIHVNGETYLSPFSISDIDNLVLYLNDPEIYKYTLRISYPYKLENARDRLDQVFAFETKHGFTKDWVIRNSNGDLIGGISLHYQDGVDSHRSEIGYWLGKPFWNQGIMTDVINVFSNYCFAELGLKRLEAIVFHFNEASAKMLEKCGYEREGLLKGFDRKNGELIDVIAFGKLS